MQTDRSAAGVGIRDEGDAGVRVKDALRVQRQDAASAARAGRGGANNGALITITLFDMLPACSGGLRPRHRGILNHGVALVAASPVEDSATPSAPQAR